MSKPSSVVKLPEMLDRYTLTLKPDELSLVLGAEVPSDYEPQFNAAPTKNLPVITSQVPDRISFQKWGWPDRGSGLII